MPLGILSLAAIIQETGFKVEVYKPQIHITTKEDYKTVAQNILKLKPEVIGFSTWCISYAVSLLVAKEIKKIQPQLPIIFGGPQASIVPKETLQEFPFVDLILTGEADHSLVTLLKELSKTNPEFDSIHGLYFRSKNNKAPKIRLNQPVTDLDKLPLPAYNLIPKLKYFKLDVGRGCPFHCTYCSTNTFFSKKYRVKSAERIVYEMISLYEKSGNKTFSFAHDMFTFNKKVVFDLCERLIGLQKTKGLNFSWTCSARLDCVTKEMLVKMKEAGCHAIFFGIETGSPKMQKIIKKNLNLSSAKEIVNYGIQLGFEVHTSFIIGFPEETDTDLEYTLQLMLNLVLQGALIQVSALSVQPGTSIFKRHKQELVMSGRFSNFSNTICGEEEIRLIRKYPEIFSSFYHLPVQTLNAEQMHVLCDIINSASDFRNTIISLPESIKTNLQKEKKPLLELFLKAFTKISSNKTNIEAISLYWIEILEKLLRSKRNSLNQKHFDILYYESISSVLKAIYTNWQILQSDKKKNEFSLNCVLKPTPIWQILKTSYKLEKILPSEHSDLNKKQKVRKGEYFYLLVVKTENNCEKIKINNKDVFLLKHLTEISCIDYLDNVSSKVSEKKTITWLKKMYQLGVFEVTNYKSEDSTVIYTASCSV